MLFFECLNQVLLWQIAVTTMLGVFTECLWSHQIVMLFTYRWHGFYSIMEHVLSDACTTQL